MNAKSDPSILSPGTLDGLERLAGAGYLTSEEASWLMDAYRFLRGVEARLRLMNTRARHDLPSDYDKLKKLALLLSMESGDSLRMQCRHLMDQVRERFNRHFPEAKPVD